MRKMDKLASMVGSFNYLSVWFKYQNIIHPWMFHFLQIMTHGSLSLDYTYIYMSHILSIYIYVLCCYYWIILMIIIVIIIGINCCLWFWSLSLSWLLSDEPQLERFFRGGGCKQCILAFRWDLMCSKVGSQQSDRFKMI